MGPRRIRMGSGEGFTMRIFIVCTDMKYKRLRWAGHVARMEEDRSSFKILTGKPIGSKPLGRSKRRWEYNVRMDLKEIRKYVSIRIGLIRVRIGIIECDI